MNGKRAYWKLLMAGAGIGAGFLFSNCTIKTESDSGSAGSTGTVNTGGSADGSCVVGTRHVGCTCAGNAIGAQTCIADGTYGACICATNSGTGGTSSTGGTETGGSATGGAPTSGGTGGSSTATAGYGGYSGGSTGGAGACDTGIPTTDCYQCLYTLCASQWAACEADNETTVAQPGDAYCLSKNTGADEGQIELILDCVAGERNKGLVKRDVVRACGATIGDSADPQYFLWAPPEMTPATQALMNCMADAPGTAAADADGWATDPTNFPEDGGAPAPWPACTCAKISCTSGQ